MGTASSKAERARKGFDSVKRPASQASQTPRMGHEGPAPDSPWGVRLSWLILHFHASLNVGDGAIVARVVEECLLPLASSDAALHSLPPGSYGPVTHVVFVHPSTPWNIFIKAILNHIRVDLRKALLCSDAPLSPRSPLVPFNSSGLRPQSNTAHTTALAVGNPGDPDAWMLLEGLGGPESPFHQTFLHLELLPADSSAVGSAWGALGAGRLTHSSQPAALLVLDPAGSIFNDPYAVRAIAAAIAILKQPQPHAQPQAQMRTQDPAPKPHPPAKGPDGLRQQPQQPQPQQLYAKQSSQALDAASLQAASSAAATSAPAPGLARDGNGGDGTDGADVPGGMEDGPPIFAAERLPRMQLTSGLGAGDCAPLVAAFGRLQVMLQHDPGVARAVTNEILEAARAQYCQYCPLLNLYQSHASLTLELDCGGLTLSEAKLLPGQIEDTARGGGGGGKASKPPASPSAPAPTPSRRSNGPGSQSCIAKIAREHSCLTPRTPAPMVPPTDPEVLSLARRSGSDTASTAVAGYVNCKRPLSRQVQLAGASCPSPGASSRAAGAGGCPAKNSPGLLSWPPAAGGDGGGDSAGVMSSRATMTPFSPPGSRQHSSHCGPGPAASPPSVSVIGGGRGSTVSMAVGASRASSREPGYTLNPMFSELAAAGLTSMCSTSGQDSVVSYAVEAARRYAALLEAMGLWAAAQGVLECCVSAAGERWGYRSAHMAALLSQLGRLQQMQGLHNAAEVTWRQALEALEASHGPESVPALLGQVALARVLVSLRAPEAEAMLRSTLTSLDTLLGPTAPETLAARAALGELLVQSGRWVEAEVAYQALLQAQEEGGGEDAADARRAQGGSGEGTGGAVGQAQGLASPRNRQAVPRASSRQQLLQGASVAPMAGGGDAAGGGGGGGSTVSSTASVRAPPGKSDSRSRTAWASGPVEGAGAGGGGGGGGAAPETASPIASQAMSWPALRSSLAPLPPIGSGNSVTGPAVIHAPLSSAALLLPPLTPPAGLSGASPQRPETVTNSKARPRFGQSSFAVGPGAAEPFAWSGVAAALADVVSAVQREYGGFNELYEGMHLAGPEGSTAADLAAAAAICPRSGACIAAVVNVRRLTDPGILYESALAIRRGVVGPLHISMLDLQLQYARHLSAAGEHSRAESVCRTCLAMLSAPGGVAATTAAGCHPAEVGVRHTLGVVLFAAGSLPAATAALMSAVAVADRLVTAGDLAAADARRLEALDCLADILWRRATPPPSPPTPPPPESAGSSAPAAASPSATSLSAASPSAAEANAPASPSSSRAYMSRAVDYKRQAIELLATVYGEHHDRLLSGWVALGQMMEAAGDLAGAERAFEVAAEAALYRHSRLSAATKAIFRQLQRVYQAQGRDTDAQLLGHMYRLKGGLLSRPAA